MKKSWMKSKSPSHASEKSTSNVATGPLRQPLWQRSRVAIPFVAFSLSLFLAACYTPPTPPASTAKEPPPSETPNADTIAPQPTSVSRSFSIDTPTPGWSLKPLYLYHVGNELWCIHQLSGPQGMVAQMISTASDEFAFVPPSEPVPPIKHFVLGKTWNWNSNPDVTYIDALTDLQSQLQSAESVPLK